eukprot:jgi/Galph1/3133/GphlegSOOS_G1763.1
MGTVEMTPSTPLPTSSSSNAFLETISLLDELVAVFENEEEVQTLRQDEKKIEELQTLQRNKLSDWKEKLKVLQARVEEATERTEGFDSEEEYQKKLENLEKEKENIIEEIMSSEDEFSHIQSKLQSIKLEEEKYSNNCSKIYNELTREIPRLQHTLSLYAEVSRLRTGRFFSSWEQLEDVFSGFILSTEGDDVRPFEFNLKRFSNYDIVNQLWSMLEEAK